MSDNKWHVLSSRYLVEEWWMSIREDSVELPNGEVLSAFHVLEVPDWVCVVAVTDATELVLVRQYRHGIRKSLLELPAGTVDKDEDVLEAAKRELLEETGFSSDSWQFLGSFHQDPSRQTNKAHMYLATGSKKTRQPDPDPSESIEVELVPATQTRWLLSTGEIGHSTHVAALLLAEPRLDLEGISLNR